MFFIIIIIIIFNQNVAGTGWFVGKRSQNIGWSADQPKHVDLRYLGYV
jgi:hypothetical protein